MVPSSYLDGRIEGDKGYGESLWKPLSEKCVNWLKTKANQSVINISFGSMMLKKCKLPKGFIKCSKGKGLIVSWCNQLETLANQAIGCFITHFGWNSTLEGLSLGMPMVAVPQWSDQMTDAKFIDEIWKIGVRPNLDELLGIVGRGAIILFK
ncbi:hypothetical protein P3S68_021720 [Capsicum galapagoense]